MSATKLKTDRLILRSWREADRETFAALNADPEVMEYFPKRHSRAESDAAMDGIQAHIREHGFGFWALEHRELGLCIGFTGLMVPGFEAPFTPCVEVGWRLARAHWGRGYATEAGRAALAFGFGALKFKEIVSFAVRANVPSQKVMVRLGMPRDPREDFPHPSLPADHPLSWHVLYRIDCDQWYDQGVKYHSS